jgi:hypothetical protein
MHLKTAITCMGEPSNAAVMEVFDMLTAFVIQSSPTIERVCSGALTLEEAITQMQAEFVP